MKEAWRGFKGTKWTDEINVREFIQNNYTPYEGNEAFLEGPTEATNILWAKLQLLQKAEREKGGVLDMETEIVSSMTAYPAALRTVPPGTGLFRLRTPPCQDRQPAPRARPRPR